MDLRGRLWLDLRIQFGGVAGCGVFGWPADLWKKIMVQVFKLKAAFRWVDDNLLVKEADKKFEERCNQVDDFLKPGASFD